MSQTTPHSRGNVFTQSLPTSIRGYIFQSSKVLPVLASTVILGSESYGTHAIFYTLAYLSQQTTNDEKDL
jgi:hypothetical protein